MPCLRHNSLVCAPASDSARMAMICFSVNLLFLMTPPLVKESHYNWIRFRGSAHPRTRGDAPEVGSRASGTRAFPPHARGCTRDEAYWYQRNRVSPARAEMHPIPAASVTSDLGFPRTRGDAPAVVRRSSGSDTFPPHARGCTPRHLRGSVSPRVSPARAGMHRDIPWYCLGVHGFPRTRG